MGDAFHGRRHDAKRHAARRSTACPRRGDGVKRGLLMRRDYSPFALFEGGIKMEPRQPTALDDFLFDLRGYLVLKQAVEPELVDDLNRTIDDLPPLEYQQWYGNAQRRDYTSATGLELHNCVEAGEPFERLIDHPGWINLVRHF